MDKENIIKIIVNKVETEVNVQSILYVQMQGNYAWIHMAGDVVYQTRITMGELEGLLGDDFIKIKRGCLVSSMAIHNVTDKVNLNNGESLVYVVRKRKEIMDKLCRKQVEMIREFNAEAKLSTDESYRQYYQFFDELPFAFTDIEMVFDEKCRAIDWVFRYGNQALAELEKMSLDKLIGKRFGKVFPDMDVKWLKSYERAALYGETLKIIDYSPEIDTYLDIICFPTFKGHCGCIMFDVSQIKSFRKNSETEKALALFIERILSD